MKIGKLNIALAITSLVAIAAAGTQTWELHNAEKDVGRYKNVGVWAVRHGETELRKYAQQRDTADADFKKYNSSLASQNPPPERVRSR